MNRNPRGYNGLQQVPVIGQGQDQIKRAIQQQMGSMTAEIYCRAAAQAIAEDFEAVSVRAKHLDDQSAKYFANLAAKCQVAGRAYFVGLGIIEDMPEQPTDPA